MDERVINEQPAPIRMLPRHLIELRRRQVERERARDERDRYLTPDEQRWYLNAVRQWRGDDGPEAA